MVEAKSRERGNGSLVLLGFLWFLFYSNLLNLFPGFLSDQWALRSYDVAFVITLFMLPFSRLADIARFKGLYLFCFWLLIEFATTFLIYGQGFLHTLTIARWYFPYFTTIAWLGFFRRVDINRLFIALFWVTAAVLLVYVFIENIAGIHVFRAGYNAEVEIGGRILHRNLSGFLETNVLFFFLVLYSHHTRLPPYNSYYRFFSTPFLIAVVFTWTRGIWISVIALVLYYFLAFAQATRKGKALLFLLVVFGLALSQSASIRERAGSIFTEVREGEGTFASRIVIFLERLDYLVEEGKLLTGIGLIHRYSNLHDFPFRVGYVEDGRAVLRTADFDPQNFLLETGVIGTMIFYGYVAGLVRRSLIGVKASDFRDRKYLVALHFSLLMGLIGIFNSATFSWSFAGFWAFQFALVEHLLQQKKV